jgi:hypothetical protein
MIKEEVCNVNCYGKAAPVLNPRTAYFKILMLIGTIQVFSIKRIIMMLENPNCLWLK